MAVGSSGAGGAIRSRLRGFLEKHRDKLRYETGDHYGNPGWTWVYPKLRLPEARERRELEILDYCATPRAEEKILREFMAAGGLNVKEIVRSRVKQGRLKEGRKGIKTVYQAGS